MPNFWFLLENFHCGNTQAHLRIDHVHKTIDDKGIVRCRTGIANNCVIERNSGENRARPRKRLTATIANLNYGRIDSIAKFSKKKKICVNSLRKLLSRIPQAYVCIDSRLQTLSINSYK